MPGGRLPDAANDFNKSDLLELLLALQGKINRELHVATLCVIEAKLDDRKYRASAFPKRKDNDAAMINLIVIRKADADIIDKALNVVKDPEKQSRKLFALAVMTDYDSSANYEHDITTSSHVAIDTTSSLHTLNNAVLTYIGDATDGTTIEEILEEWEG